MRTEKGKSINADNYVGVKTEIEFASIEAMKFGAVIKAVSKPIEFKGDDSLPGDQILRATKIFSLGISEVDGSFIVLENSKLDKFLADKKVKITGEYKVGERIREMEGIKCIVQKTETGFLELA